MADEGRGDRHYFWELVLSNVIGTAVGFAIAHYATNRGLKVDRYIDKTINFLEGVKKKSQPEYGLPAGKENI